MFAAVNDLHDVAALILRRYRDNRPPNNILTKLVALSGDFDALFPESQRCPTISASIENRYFRQARESRRKSPPIANFTAIDGVGPRRRRLSAPIPTALRRSHLVPESDRV